MGSRPSKAADVAAAVAAPVGSGDADAHSHGPVAAVSAHSTTSASPRAQDEVKSCRARTPESFSTHRASTHWASTMLRSTRRNSRSSRGSSRATRRAAAATAPPLESMPNSTGCHGINQAGCRQLSWRRTRGRRAVRRGRQLDGHGCDRAPRPPRPAGASAWRIHLDATRDRAPRPPRPAGASAWRMQLVDS